MNFTTVVESCILIRKFLSESQLLIKLSTAISLHYFPLNIVDSFPETLQMLLKQPLLVPALT
jgi:hypothetical protein